MKHPNLNYRLYLILVAAGLLVVFLFIWWPLVNQLVLLNSQLVANRQMLASLTQKRATLEAVDENALKTKNDFLFRLLPPTADPLVLVSGLRLLTEKTGVTLDEIGIGSVDKAKIETQLSLKADLVGELDRLLEFASLAQEVYPFITLKFDKISGDEAGSYRATLEATTFFQAIPDRVDPIETPVAPLLPKENELFTRFFNLKPLFSTSDAQNNFVEVQSGKTNPFAF